MLASHVVRVLECGWVVLRHPDRHTKHLRASSSRVRTWGMTILRKIPNMQTTAVELLCPRCRCVDSAPDIVVWGPEKLSAAPHGCPIAQELAQLRISRVHECSCLYTKSPLVYTQECARNIYLYMYTHTYTYIYIYIICICTYIYIYIYMYIYTTFIQCISSTNPPEDWAPWNLLARVSKMPRSPDLRLRRSRQQK